MTGGWLRNKVNCELKPRGCSAERMGSEGERVDRLRTERRPVVLHSEGLESDGIEGRGVPWVG